MLRLTLIFFCYYIFWEENLLIDFLPEKQSQNDTESHKVTQNDTKSHKMTQKVL